MERTKATDTLRLKEIGSQMGTDGGRSLQNRLAVGWSCCQPTGVVMETGGCLS